MKIGVFDSGIGGLSVAHAIEAALPMAEVVFVTDPEHFPYATKTPAEIWEGIVPIFQSLVDQKCDAIVVACNTVSTTLIDRLRQSFADVPLLGLEPMIKPAVQLSASKIVCVCATPTTLASQRYHDLKQQYAAQAQIIEPDCSDWSKLIEENAINEAKLRAAIQPALAAGADVIVLGCTHYHWIESEIRELAGPGVEILQPEQAVISQLKRVLSSTSEPVA
jgi:glutamate racemase